MDVETYLWKNKHGLSDKQKVGCHVVLNLARQYGRNTRVVKFSELQGVIKNHDPSKTELLLVDD